MQEVEVRPVAVGSPPGSRARIGLIGLATGIGTERDMHQILSQEGVLLASTRVRDQDTVNADTLSGMEGDLRRAADTLLPGEPLDVVAYGCTSGAVAIGEAKVAEIVKSARECFHVTNQFRSSVTALYTMRASRICLVCPYIPALTALIRDYLEREGLQVVHAVAFDRARSSEITAIPAQEILREAIAADRPNADAIFLCCGGLNTLGILDELERRLDKPVVSSNQTLAWHALRLAGVNDELVGYGRLFSFPLLETRNETGPAPFAAAAT